MNFLNLSQDVIPTAPHSAAVSSFSLKSLHDMAPALRLASDTDFLGLATGPPSKIGILPDLAIATPSRVFYLSIPENDLNDGHKLALKSLFTLNDKQRFAAFEMAQLIPLLSTTFGCSVSGIDLSMPGACSDERLSPFKSPGEFIESVIPSVKPVDVNRCLEFGDDDGIQAQVCRRAWFSAMYVFLDFSVSWLAKPFKALFRRSHVFQISQVYASYERSIFPVR